MEINIPKPTSTKKRTWLSAQVLSRESHQRNQQQKNAVLCIIGEPKSTGTTYARNCSQLISFISYLLVYPHKLQNFLEALNLTQDKKPCWDVQDGYSHSNVDINLSIFICFRYSTHEIIMPDKSVDFSPYISYKQKQPMDRRF